MSSLLRNVDDEEGIHRVFPCDCGKSYKTEAGFKQHKRRYCKGAVTDTEFKCDECGRVFSTYSGMRLHVMKAHESIYNAEMQIEAGRSSRRRWSNAEEDQMAELEAGYIGQALLTYLSTCMSRTVDAIKGRRKMSSYKEKVAHLKSRIAYGNESTLDATRPTLYPESVREQSLERSATESTNQTALTIEVPSPIRHFNDATPSTTVLMVNTNTTPETAVVPQRTDAVMLHLEAIKRRKVGLTSNDAALIDAIVRKEFECDKKFETWTRSLLQTVQSKNHRPQNRKSPTTTPIPEQSPLSGRRNRAKEYRLTQKEFKRDKKRCANRIIDGKLRTNSHFSPTSEDILTAYKEIFSEPQKNYSIETDFLENNISLYFPITKDEIVVAMKSLKSKTPGPDKISGRHLNQIPALKLEILFNSMLYLGYTPVILKTSRTILIPKTNTNLENVHNWRPITITSLVLRLCNKIWVKRMNATAKLDEGQKGFRNVDGCFIHTLSLETIIKKRRMDGTPLTIISLDLKKAFDSVPHAIIWTALRRMNVDEKTIAYLQSNYTNVSTTIECNGQNIGTINIKKGVKQGDPVSPILFNTVLDILVTSLNKCKYGIQVGNTSISCLAYADDIILLANTKFEARALLNKCLEFFSKTGLSINPSKCAALILETVPSKKKLYTVTNPTFHVNDQTIPQMDVIEVFKYLGLHFSNKGLSKCTLGALNEQLSNIIRAPLKPQQKFSVIREFLLPRYTHHFQNPCVKLNKIKEADRKIRIAVRKILHMNCHANNAILYTPMKRGGLGLICLSQLIPVLLIERWNNLQGIDELTNEIKELSNPWIERVKKYIKNDLNTKKKIKDHNSNILEKSFSGNGMDQMGNNPGSNAFLHTPPLYWTGEDYIRAVLLRFNLLPTKSIPSNPVDERRCRAGCFKQESLSHILQNCPLTHWPRIQRHNYVCNRLATAGNKKGWQVTAEPHIRDDNGILKKPDLLFEKDDTVIITDVSISWEGPEKISSSFALKQNIYSTPRFVEMLQRSYPNKKIYVLPYILGARGAWCHLNRYLTHHIGLNANEIKDTIQTCMRGSWTMHQYFMKIVWRDQARGNA